jgi:Ni,Fe-hydrogenase I small subunit
VLNPRRIIMPQCYNLVWLRGIDCDGCTIAAMGEMSAGGLEHLLFEHHPGLPHINLIHPLLALEAGDQFVDQLRRCGNGELGQFGVLVESAIPPELPGNGYFGALGEENGQPIAIGTWLERLAAGCDFVIAIGDCAVWGGPHSIGENPTRSTGADSSRSSPHTTCRSHSARFRRSANGCRRASRRRSPTPVAITWRGCSTPPTA